MKHLLIGYGVAIPFMIFFVGTGPLIFVPYLMIGALFSFFSAVAED